MGSLQIKCVWTLCLHCSPIFGIFSLLSSHVHVLPPGSSHVTQDGPHCDVREDCASCCYYGCWKTNQVHFYCHFQVCTSHIEHLVSISSNPWLAATFFFLPVFRFAYLRVFFFFRSSATSPPTHIHRCAKTYVLSLY